MVKLLVALISLVTLASCQTSSVGSAKPLSPAALSHDYEKSPAEVRRKYDGREITVTGYTVEAAMVPEPGDDQGLVLLAERDSKPAQQVACWFSEDQAAQFATIEGGQLITVQGIFNGESGVDLRFCKLVKQGKEN